MKPRLSTAGRVVVTAAAVTALAAGAGVAAAPASASDHLSYCKTATPPSWLPTFTLNAAKSDPALPDSWGSGSQFTALKDIVCMESSFSPTAANPSGAYGLGQLMPRTLTDTGVSYEHYHHGGDGHYRGYWQMLAMMRYIKDRPAYGSPAAAWTFWQSHGWY